MPMKHVPPGTQKVDYTKEYSNGHKCLTAAQAKALTELLKQEDVKRNTFKLHSDLMVMPRNPLIGEPTPREASGEVIMNPNSTKLLGKVIGGIPILPPGRPLRKYNEPQTPVGKIGIDDRLHNILGNQTANLTAAQPIDLKQFALGAYFLLAHSCTYLFCHLLT